MSDDEFDFTQPQDKLKTAAGVSSTLPPPPSAPFKPANSKFYDNKVAEAFFREHGKEERIVAGATLFTEGDKSGKQGLFGKRVIHRMYYLTEGEVVLTAYGKPLDTIRSGEVIGEMAVISEIPDSANASSRSATAMAKAEVTAFSLDGAETQAGLARKPEFALMLMSVMFDRLRFVAARLAMRKAANSTDIPEALAVFNSETLDVLESKLDRATVLRFDAGRVIMREGDAGTTMYVILRGKVAISIKGIAVETATTGVSIGEMALVDQTARAATATATTDCKLLAINRKALIDLVSANPDIGMSLMRSMAARLRSMNILLNT